MTLCGAAGGAGGEGTGTGGGGGAAAGWGCGGAGSGGCGRSAWRRALCSGSGLGASGVSSEISAGRLTTVSRRSSAPGRRSVTSRSSRNSSSASIASVRPRPSARRPAPERSRSTKRDAGTVFG
ncbi:MAG: hypothetical protein E6G92_02195 [Alphaproteobacteria bacterium]|nr:MAG: hypothetical protein E6G92_02195 [Alphaproteobacteria bacterium]